MSNHTPTSKRVVIIGGGITGLSAAWYLQNEELQNLHITLIETADQLGGKMTTKEIFHNDNSFIIDAGPESFVTRKPEAWELAHELGLEEEIIDPGSETKNMYVLDEGKVKKIPLSPPAFISSDLLSFRGKLRMMAEPFIPARKDDEDESLADFVTRRLGKEALDKMLGPVLAGIYNTDPTTQSIMTTSPVMREMEKEHGGLFKGALARMQARKKNQTDVPRRPQFFAFKSGSQVMVDALENQLNAKILKNTKVLSISKEHNLYQISLSNQETIQADAIILAAPSNQSGKLIQDVASEASELLAKIKHENIGTATLIFSEGGMNLPYEINGLMIPRKENRKIDAVTWTTNKPLPRAPQGYEMIRVFFGGGDPSLVSLPEEKILEIIVNELKEILQIEISPLASAIFAWANGFPQAYVGHQKLVEEIEANLPPNIFIAGGSYRGIGIPDCIRQGQVAAMNTNQYLKN